MANPTTKQELLASMTDGYAKLCEQIAKMSEEEKTRSFDFAADPKKTLPPTQRNAACAGSMTVACVTC